MTPDGQPLLTELESAWSIRNNDPERAQQSAAQHLHTELHPQAQIVLAYLNWRAGKYSEAAEQATEALETLQAQAPSLWLGRVYNVLGGIQSILNRRNESIRLYDQQIQVAHAIGDQELEAIALHDIGVDLVPINPQRARFHIEHALPIFKAVGDEYGVAIAHLNLGELEQDTGNFQAAAQHFEYLLTHYLHLHQIPILECTTRSRYIQTLDALGDLERRAQQEWRLQALNAQHHNPDIQILTALTLTRHPNPAALALLNPALQAAQELGHERLPQLHERLSEVHAQLGDTQTALEHLRRALQLERQTYTTEREQQFRTLEVLHRTRTLQSQVDEERRKTEQLQTHVRELQALNIRIQHLSRTDSLTGLYNRHHLFHEGERLARAATPESPLSLAIIDVDHFKTINDTHGHLIGDLVLQQLAHLLQNHQHPGDLTARYGGDEFILLRPNTTTQNLLTYCETLRRSIQTHPWIETHPDLHVTASIGIATTGGEHDFETTLHTADEHLYTAKNNGRNTIQYQH